MHLVLYHLDSAELPPEELFDTTAAARHVFREHLFRFHRHFEQDEPLAQLIERGTKAGIVDFQFLGSQTEADQWFGDVRRSASWPSSKKWCSRKSRDRWSSSSMKWIRF